MHGVLVRKCGTLSVFFFRKKPFRWLYSLRLQSLSSCTLRLPAVASVFSPRYTKSASSTFIRIDITASLSWECSRGSSSFIFLTCFCLISSPGNIIIRPKQSMNIGINHTGFIAIPVSRQHISPKPKPTLKAPPNTILRTLSTAPEAKVPHANHHQCIDKHSEPRRCSRRILEYGAHKRSRYPQYAYCARHILAQTRSVYDLYPRFF